MLRTVPVLRTNETRPHFPRGRAGMTKIAVFLPNWIGDVVMASCRRRRCCDGISGRRPGWSASCVPIWPISWAARLGWTSNGISGHRGVRGGQRWGLAGMRCASGSTWPCCCPTRWTRPCWRVWAERGQTGGLCPRRPRLAAQSQAVSAHPLRHKGTVPFFWPPATKIGTVP